MRTIKILCLLSLLFLILPGCDNPPILDSGKLFEVLEFKDLGGGTARIKLWNVKRALILSPDNSLITVDGWAAEKLTNGCFPTAGGTIRFKSEGRVSICVRGENDKNGEIEVVFGGGKVTHKITHGTLSPPPPPPGSVPCG